jgi:branched-chain amino acid transport system ATP-binding protein
MDKQPPSDSLLTVNGLMKSFGKLQVSFDLDLQVREGEIHALIGPNGAGKTTLISQLTGLLQPDAGTIYFKGKNLKNLPVHKRAQAGLARTFQITSVFQEFTALDNVALAIQATKGHSFKFWSNAKKDMQLRAPAMEALEVIGLLGRANTLASELAHGEQSLLELAMAMARKPSMLLLDEPMAGMSIEETKQVIKALKTLKGKVTMLLIEHDMDAVFSLADRLSVLVYGQIIATGTPDEIRANSEVQRAYLGEEEI